MTNRVVITGVGAYSPIGNDWPTIEANLRALQSGVRHIPEWEEYEGLNTKLGAPVTDYEPPASFNRKNTRSMGRVAMLATAASERALTDAGLLGDPLLQSGRVGVAYGSSTGTTK